MRTKTQGVPARTSEACVRELGSIRERIANYGAKTVALRAREQEVVVELEGHEPTPSEVKRARIVADSLQAVRLWLDGRTHAEIAVATGRPVSWIAQQLRWRAKREFAFGLAKKENPQPPTAVRGDEEWMAWWQATWALVESKWSPLVERRDRAALVAAGWDGK